MTFRLRLAIAAALVVAVSVAVASIVVYVVMRNELLRNVDSAAAPANRGAWSTSFSTRAER